MLSICDWQVLADTLQFLKTTTSELSRLRHQMKRNKVRSLSDASSQSVCPRQPLTATMDTVRDRCQPLMTAAIADCQHA